MVDKPYVLREDIELERLQEYEVTLLGERQNQIAVGWTATLDGPLSTGERVRMVEYSSAHAGEALLLLEEAIAAQGWTIL